MQKGNERRQRVPVVQCRDARENRFKRGDPFCLDGGLVHARSVVVARFLPLAVAPRVGENALQHCKGALAHFPAAADSCQTWWDGMPSHPRPARKLIKVSARINTAVD